jgi:hypothetical protein
VANIKIGPKDDEKKTTMQKVVNKTLWLISTTRNATLVIVTGVIGWALQNNGLDPFVLIGKCAPRLATFQGRAPHKKCFCLINFSNIWHILLIFISLA